MWKHFNLHLHFSIRLETRVIEKGGVTGVDDGGSGGDGGGVSSGGGEWVES